MKIAFTDFWWKFNSRNNFFIDSAKRIVENIEVVDNVHDADLLIFSCYSNDHRAVDRSKTKKFYFTGENTRPPVDECDYAATFDFDSYDGKNFRLPLWMLQIDWWKSGGYENPHFVIPLENVEDNHFRKKKERMFCSTVFNRDHTGHRIRTLKELTNYKPVDCFGEPWNNWFYGEDVKLNVISNYKFTLCYENSIFPGYFTEKPIHARTAGCIPIYWSHKIYEEDFNPKGFINLIDYESIEHLVEQVKRIDNDEKLYKAMLSEPVFTKKPSIDPFMQFYENLLKSVK